MTRPGGSARPVDLQDWAVPVVYEAAPLTLLRPARDAPLFQPRHLRHGGRGRTGRGRGAPAAGCGVLRPG